MVMRMICDIKYQVSCQHIVANIQHKQLLCKKHIIPELDNSFYEGNLVASVKHILLIKLLMNFHNWWKPMEQIEEFS